MKTYGLIGKTLSHSFSPKYFTHKFIEEKINNAQYLPFELESIEHFSSLLKNRDDLAGLNVTIPYKEAIIPFLDDLSEDAMQIGAVNTISFENDRVKGYNTDVLGFKNSLTPLLLSSDQKALVLGNGGASKAVCHALQQLKIEATIVSRSNKEKGKILLYDELNAALVRSNTVIINTTPLGTHPNIQEMPPFPVEFITQDHLVYDLIYNPEHTLLLKTAAKNGARIKNGYEMLVLQAEESWRIWNNS